MKTLTELQEDAQRLNNHMQHGCGDGNCRIKRPTGQHTNGGCQCDPERIALQFLMLASEIEKHAGPGRRFKTDAQVADHNRD